MLHAAEGHRRGELSQAREQRHVQTNFVRRVVSGSATRGEISSALNSHPNTVRQRLDRFEEATGRSLRETETVVEVWWALQRRRLS
jgi:sugar diacid utilization regulator